MPRVVIRMVPNGVGRAVARDIDASQFMAKVGVAVANRAKRLAPVRTGYLRSSIGSRVVRGPNGLPAVHVFANANYALYIEYGTQNARAQPFLRPAILQSVDV